MMKCAMASLLVAVIMFLVGCSAEGVGLPIVDNHNHHAADSSRRTVNKVATFRASGETIIARVDKEYYNPVNDDVINRLILTQLDPITGEEGKEKYTSSNPAACAVFNPGAVVEISGAIVDRNHLTSDGTYAITSCLKVQKYTGENTDVDG